MFPRCCPHCYQIRAVLKGYMRIDVDDVEILLDVRVRRRVGRVLPCCYILVTKKSIRCCHCRYRCRRADRPRCRAQHSGRPAGRRACRLPGLCVCGVHVPFCNLRRPAGAGGKHLYCRLRPLVRGPPRAHPLPNRPKSTIRESRTRPCKVDGGNKKE